ncbi:hypothetical protein AAE02nite_47710 [Adhaeribacter aerolatus]|uniref:Uncharacterized protein n=1 Tax=Adhaeribacter aerolatus TaxID=670289 RepID=A0A512B5Q4_9BACT|nr:hypothetical protein [Adhaeribacter aerolatus]GEO07107.1 hypothetical protein AAE02nite_47710 [Adhaeribacter aerolatus]
MKWPGKYARKWILACALGELLGIGAAGAIAFAVNHTLGEPVTLPQKLTVLGCMLAAGAVEGSLLGYMQWRVLQERIPRLPALEWMGWTVAVAVLGWFLGMLPSLFFLEGTADNSPQSPAVALENPLVLSSIAVGMGLLVGALFGLFQWFSLRKYIPAAGKWILANALGWGLGLGWIYLAASWPDENTSLPLIIISGILGGILAGLSVGLITGIYLPKLTQPKSQVVYFLKVN